MSFNLRCTALSGLREAYHSRGASTVSSRFRCPGVPLAELKQDPLRDPQSGGKMPWRRAVWMPVVVRAARCNQTVSPCTGQKKVDGMRVVDVMIHFDACQTHIFKGADEVCKHSRVRANCPRMRQRANTPRPCHQCKGFVGCQIGFRHIAWDEKLLKCLLGTLHITVLEQGLRQVRAGQRTLHVLHDVSAIERRPPLMGEAKVDA